MHQYTTYGVNLESTCLITELEERSNSNPPDLIIREEPYSTPSSESTDSDRKLIVRDETVWLEYPGVGSFRIRMGSEILVDAESTVDLTALIFHLLGPALAVALHQRGRLVLHASAVVIKGNAVLFVGDTHAGKSTLAAHCANTGHALLADDLGVIELDDEVCYLYSGFPSAKLDTKTAAVLDQSRKNTLFNIEQLDEGSTVDKAYYPTRAPDERGPFPVERIYILADGDSIQLKSLAGPEAIATLYCHAYLRELAERNGDSKRLLDRCSALAEQIPVKRLSRPWDLDQLPAVIERIEADVGE